MLNTSTRDSIQEYAENGKVSKNIQVEIGHISVGLNQNEEVKYGQLQGDGERIIPKGLIESVCDGFELVDILNTCKKDVGIVLSLSDIYGVSKNEREKIKGKISTLSGLGQIFENIGFEKQLIEFYKEYIDNGRIIVQSNGTSSIYNKISQVKERYPRKSPETIYYEKGYILFDVITHGYHGQVLYSNGCFNNLDPVLQYGIPLLLGEEGKTLATQCGPTVTGIQRQILKDFPTDIITVDNKKDGGIKTKSLRGQELLKIFYGKQSGFLTPSKLGELSLLHNHNGDDIEKQQDDYNTFKSMCINKLIEGGYESAKIYGENELLFIKNNKSNMSCNLGICNLNS
ncbi:MAG: hypothetical protein WC850_00710 [Candidatus Gracilibacteria bacterium]